MRLKKENQLYIAPPRSPLMELANMIDLSISISFFGEYLERIKENLARLRTTYDIFDMWSPTRGLRTRYGPAGRYASAASAHLAVSGKTWWVVGWKFHMGMRIDDDFDDDDEDEDAGRMSDVCQKRNWLVSRWCHSIIKQSFKTKIEILQVGHMVSSNSPSQHSCRIYVFLLDIIFLTSCSRHGLRLASSVQAASCWLPVVI